MELHQALAEITSIREHVLRTQTFRGYRSLTVGFSGLLAFASAGLQHAFIPRPQEQIGSYLMLWVGTATLAILVTGSEMLFRATRSQSGLARQHTLLAIEQFLPAVLVGAVLTAVVGRRMPDALWMLPGVWAMLVSLGVFASSRLLPRGVFFVAAYYFLCGAILLVRASDSIALAPWSMGLIFGVGQLAMATILYVSLERKA